MQHFHSDGVEQFELERPRAVHILLIQGCLLVAAGYAAVVARNPLVTLVLVLSSVLLRTRASETVLVIQNFGIQIKRRGAVRWLEDTSRFISACDILDIVINEVFSGFEVIHVLQIVVRDADTLEPLFIGCTKLSELELVWRHVHELKSKA